MAHRHVLHAEVVRLLNTLRFLFHVEHPFCKLRGVAFQAVALGVELGRSDLRAGEGLAVLEVVVGGALIIIQHDQVPLQCILEVLIVNQRIRTQHYLHKHTPDSTDLPGSWMAGRRPIRTCCRSQT